jgi:membrane protease YdiL (CAAX protease family)
MLYDMNSRQGVTYTAGFFILFGLMGVGLIVGSLAGAGIWVAMTGQGFTTMQKGMLDPANVQAVRMLQLVSTFFIFFVPAYLTSLILHRKPLRFLGFNLYFTWRELGLAIAIMVAALPLVGTLSELNKLIPIPASLESWFLELEETYEQQVKVLSRIDGFPDYLLSLLVMALAPAVFEETFFRGGMQHILHGATRRPWLAIVLTSLVFSAIHFSYYGFIPRFCLGMVLGLLYYYSGSLWLSIAGHFFNNALVVTQIYVLRLQGKSIDAAMEESGPWWMGILTGIVMIGLFMYYRMYCEQSRKKLMPPEDRALEERWIA